VLNWTEKLQRILARGGMITSRRLIDAVPILLSAKGK